MADSFFDILVFVHDADLCDMSLTYYMEYRADGTCRGSLGSHGVLPTLS